MAKRFDQRAVVGILAAGLIGAAAGGCGAPDDPRLSHVSGDAERGRALMSAYGCASCHAIPNVAGGNSRVGPPLWGMADRGYIGGVLPNTEEAMVLWLLNPRAVATRTAMPDLHVTEEHARDMTAFLYTLRAEPVIVRMLRGYFERATGRQSQASAEGPAETQLARVE
jgi:cytochrome c